MKILFLSHHIKGNDGWSRYARDIIRAVRQEGAEVLCLVHELSPETDIPQKKCLEKPLAYVANPLRSFLSAIKINKAISEFSPDIIQFIVEPYGSIIPFLHKRRSKIVLNAHSTYAFLPALISGMRRIVTTFTARQVYDRTDTVVCISKYTAQYVKRRLSEIHAEHAISNKIVIMGGGVDIIPETGHIPSRLIHARKEILFVGAIKPRKGLIEAIEALALIKTNFIYRIVGYYEADNLYVKKIIRKINELQLKDKVELVGQVSDDKLRLLYKDADLFLMLSTNNGADFEGYGIVYLEANLYGVPCIGPRDSGVSDAILDGKTGYLVDQHDSSSVAQTIESVLGDHMIRSADCVNWAKENSIKNRAKTMMAIYENLITQ